MQSPHRLAPGQLADLNQKHACCVVTVLTTMLSCSITHIGESALPHTSPQMPVFG